MNSLCFFFIDKLGTKIDLREDREFGNQLQKQNILPIKREQGQRLCKKIRAFKYVECSALTQKGLKQVNLLIDRFVFVDEFDLFRFEVFDDAVRSVLSPKTNKASKSNCVFL